MDDLEFVDEILDDDNVAIERDSLDYLDDILELNDEELEPDDEILDDEFIETHLIPVNTTTIQNFPFVEDDIDAITDYELFSKGFGYLDDKKADKEELSEYVKKDEIPPLDDFVTKDTTELENYTLTSDLSRVALTGDYDDLSNKPVIPDVSNYVTKDTTELENYTLTSDLSEVALSGDYDDLSNKPTIPTKTSDLNNDSGFITKDVNDLDNYTLTSSLATVATTGDYDDLIDKPTIPDVSNFITKDVNDLTYYTLTSNLSSVATSGSYNDLSNKPTIPTKTSDLNNDSGFITNSVNNLTNYTDTTTLNSLLANKEDISEYGSNTNGYYVKFANGVLLEWNRMIVDDQAIASSYGSVYQGTRNITFPIAFVGELPTVQCSEFQYGSGASWGCVVGNGTTLTGTQLRGWDFYSRATGTNCRISWIAIGRWK